MTPLEALQAALAAEHAAVYVTGILGAQTSQSEQADLYDAVQAAYRAHRRSRDQLTVLIHARGATPVAAAVAYAVPARLRTTAELNGAALRVEHRTAAVYGQLVENTTDAERRWALVALDRAAVRQLRFQGTPETFPGAAT